MPAATAPIEQFVDTDRYPLTDPGSQAWDRAVAGVRAELAEHGCSVLADFIRPDVREELRAECASIADRAYEDVEVVNVYNTAPDDTLPEDHPARRTVLRGNAFVAWDDIPEEFVIHRLYLDRGFQSFLAACLELPEVHVLGDPLAGLCLNVVRPGNEHPWHFDTNEFAVSMVTQTPDDGGAFEYSPGIRTPEDEHLSDIAAVLDGRGGDRVRRLTLRPGDLQLFRGRYSLHRVTTVQGGVPRHSAIFSYSQRPGVVGNAERTRQLFGRLTPQHQQGRAGRVDELMD